MSKNQSIKISREDASQILDCLERRIEDWADTARLLRGEPASSEFFIPEECHKPEEAEWVATRYKEIFERIDNKLKVFA